MKKYLLDTCILIWWLEDAPELSSNLKKIITKNEAYVSSVSIWEIVIKKGLGKLKIADDFYDHIHQNQFSILPILDTHILKTQDLPPIHRDPFDRMLAAQALSENLTLITTDKKLWDYPILIEKGL